MLQQRKRERNRPRGGVILVERDPGISASVAKKLNRIIE